MVGRTPLRRHKAVALPLMPVTWRSLRYHGYDWAFISSHAFAHHAYVGGAPNGFRRMVYIHTPARYVWMRAFDARGNNPVARLVSHVLRPLDRRRAHEGAEFAANSMFVRNRMLSTWGVDARVIHPPVDVEKIQAVPEWRDVLQPGEAALLDALPDGFVLGASRFIPYKRLEDVIKVGEATGRPVVLAGKGPHLPQLQVAANAASVPMHFVHAPSDSLLYALYQRTALFVFPAVEDFGIRTPRAVCDRNELDPSRRSRRGDLPFTNNQAERWHATSPRSTMLQDRVARPLIPARPPGAYVRMEPGITKRAVRATLVRRARNAGARPTHRTTFHRQVETGSGGHNGMDASRVQRCSRRPRAAGSIITLRTVPITPDSPDLPPLAGRDVSAVTRAPTCTSTSTTKPDWTTGLARSCHTLLEESL